MPNQAIAPLIVVDRVARDPPVRGRTGTALQGRDATLGRWTAGPMPGMGRMAGPWGTLRPRR